MAEKSLAALLASLGPGSVVERTESGWEVRKRVPHVAHPVHGAGKTIEAAFASFGAINKPDNEK